MKKARALGSQPKTSRSELPGSPLKGFPATPAPERQAARQAGRQTDKLQIYTNLSLGSHGTPFLTYIVTHPFLP